jgi:hypothetical protein
MMQRAYPAIRISFAPTPHEEEATRLLCAPRSHLFEIGRFGLPATASKGQQAQCQASAA